jgi:hypothetical protein
MRIRVIAGLALALPGVLTGCGGTDHAPGAIKAAQAAQRPAFVQSQTWTAECLDAGQNRVECSVTTINVHDSSIVHHYRVTGTVDGDRELWDAPTSG